MGAAWQKLLWALGLFLFLGAGVLFFFLPASFSRYEAPVRFEVTPGMSSLAIARRLESMGVIRAHWAFQVVALAQGTTGRLKAGPYQAYPYEPPWEIVGRLARGDMLDTLVTIPEGWNTRDIAGRLAPILECTQAEFLSAARDSSLMGRLGVPGPGLEGYLYPDSYRLIPGTPALEVVERLVRRTLEVFAERFQERADSLGFTRHEILTLASLVEAEAHIDEERSRIAAVFHNRLREGMKLQADPTVAYVLGSRPERLLERDLLVESPYNTYLVQGLPPGPICSPGAASVYAALYPLPDCGDLYFVATGNGRHLFSTTNEAHNRARQRVASGASPAGD